MSESSKCSAPEAEGPGSDNCFTLVFRGKLRDVGGNPFHVVTPFGTPFAAGIGNAFDELEAAADEGALAELAATDADVLGADLYRRFWARNPGGIQPTDWRDQAEAIRRMWRGIGVDALRSLLNPAESGASNGTGGAPSPRSQTRDEPESSNPNTSANDRTREGEHG